MSAHLEPEEVEMLDTLVEIQREKQHVRNIDVRRLRFIADRERAIELHFNNRPFSHHASCGLLARLARSTGLHGLFVLDQADPEPLYVDDECLFATTALLELLDQLLDDPDASPWTDGLDYLIDLLKYESRASEGTRFQGSNPVCTAHLHAWAGWQGRPDRAESCARALVLGQTLGQSCLPLAHVSRATIERHLKLVGPEAVDEVHAAMCALGGRAAA